LKRGRNEQMQKIPPKVNQNSTINQKRGKKEGGDRSFWMEKMKSIAQGSLSLTINKEGLEGCTVDRGT